MATIRPGTRNDLAALHMLDKEFGEQGTPFWALVSDDAMLSKIDSGMLIVTADENKLVAYLMWTLFWGRPFIEFIRLLPEHRNQRLGTQMLEHLVMESSRRGYSMIWSSTENPDALRWHIRNGFKQVGETEWMWGPTREIWLMKELERQGARKSD